MIDFKSELNKLLAMESDPLPQSELTEIAAISAELQKALQSLNKKQTDISLQVEEIYDLTKDTDTSTLQEVLRSEKERAARLAWAAMGLCDLIDDFYEFSLQSGNDELEHHARLMRKNADGLLEECAITRFGESGQRLDPRIHTVLSGAISDIPREHIVKVLQSGYRYLGTIIRKAAVVVSTGMEESEE